MVAEQYRANQHAMIAKAKRLKLAAEEKVAAQELYETTMLLEAVKHGDDFTSLDPKTAINVARAARDTLMAEEHLAISRVQECEAVLTGLHDAVEEVHARVKDANLQVGRLLSIINSQGIHVAPSMKLYLPPSSENDLLTIFNTSFPTCPTSTSPSSYYSASESADNLATDNSRSELAVSD